jgi:Ca2+/Na+ antiporter
MKYLNYIIIFLAFIFITVWIFNHVNAWVSILFAVLCIYGRVYYIEKQQKNKKNNKQ